MTLASGVAWVALVAVSPASAASLAEGIDRTIAASPVARGEFWGIQVIDLGTGKTL